MKILLFSPSYAPRRGGLETMTRRLASELANRGHAVTVATNRYPRALPACESIDGIEVYRQLYPRLLPCTERRSLREEMKRWVLLPLVPVVLFRLMLLTRRVRPDIVNIHFLSDPSVYMLFVAWLLGLPVVISFHGADLPTVPYAANRPWPVRIACEAAAAYTVCSVEMRDHLFKLLDSEKRTRVIVAHNGADDVVSGSAASSVGRDGYVLSVGRLVKKKGFDVVIHGMALLRERGISIDLVVAGEGPCRTKLEDLATDLGVASQVTFLGEVSPAHVRDLMRDARIVAVPSRWEAFGLVCLEAMMLCKPVVASRAGGIPEIVLDGETGILVPPGDAAALSRALETLLTRPALMDAMGARGRERAVADFSWRSAVDEYLQAYRRALRSCPESRSGDAPGGSAGRTEDPLRHGLTRSSGVEFTECQEPTCERELA